MYRCMVINDKEKSCSLFTCLLPLGNIGSWIFTICIGLEMRNHFNSEEMRWHEICIKCTKKTLWRNVETLDWYCVSLTVNVLWMLKYVFSENTYTVQSPDAAINIKNGQCKGQHTSLCHCFVSFYLFKQYKICLCRFSVIQVIVKTFHLSSKRFFSSG